MGYEGGFVSGACWAFWAVCVVRWCWAVFTGGQDKTVLVIEVTD